MELEYPVEYPPIWLGGWTWYEESGAWRNGWLDWDCATESIESIADDPDEGFEAILTNDFWSLLIFADWEVVFNVVDETDSKGSAIFSSCFATDSLNIVAYRSFAGIGML